MQRHDAGGVDTRAPCPELANDFWRLSTIRPLLSVGYKKMKGLLNATLHLLKEIFNALPKLIAAILTVVRRICELHRRSDGKQRMHCLPIPSGVYLRPDASIYSQRYLMSLGMAVTWDNPDVNLTDGLGNVVGSHDLQPSTSYQITATIHNRSNDAPVPPPAGMPVIFSLLRFGVLGTTVQTIGSTVVDHLPVRGAPGEPVHASITWVTPPVPGHYCIQIEAVVPDDANQLDNVGQHNTVIRGVHHAEALALKIPVRNALQGARTFSVQLHSYRLPAEPLIRKGLGGRLQRRSPSHESSPEQRESDSSLLARVVAVNRADLFPPPPEWNPDISHRRLTIQPDQTVELEFTATVPSSAPAGFRQPFHVAVFEESSKLPIGGVTAIFIVQ